MKNQGSLPQMKIRRMMETTPHKEYGKTPSHKGMKNVWNVSS